MNKKMQGRWQLSSCIYENDSVSSLLTDRLVSQFWVEMHWSLRILKAMLLSSFRACGATDTPSAILIVVSLCMSIFLSESFWDLLLICWVLKNVLWGVFKHLLIYFFNCTCWTGCSFSSVLFILFWTLQLLSPVLPNLSFWNTYQLDDWFSNFLIFCLPFSFSVCFTLWAVILNSSNHGIKFFIFVIKLLISKSSILFHESSLLDYPVLFVFLETII